MKQIILLFLLLIGVMFAAYWLSQTGNMGKIKLANFNFSQESTPEADISNSKIVKIGKNEIKVEIANTDDKRRVGLSEHTSLADDSGMLFVFDKQNERPVFWMKGMEISIDIIWINDGRVAQITSNAPVPKEGTQDSDLPRYLPNDPVDYVLEIPAGQARKKGIKAGDPVEIPQI